MKRRYLGILVVSVVLAVVLTVWGGSIRGRSRFVDVQADSASIRPVEVTLRIEPDGGMTPPSVSVEKGKRVHVSVTNTGRAPARVELLGYEDIVLAGSVEAGGTWSFEFVADRPGEDFAWVVNGNPASLFLVTGSHLVEGHR